MALIINHNLPALKAARYLGSAYNSLSKSIERLSSGLRINTAGDDAAGLAVRELMRADIGAGYQGIRNAADGVSLIQTADGALGIIDAKLIRMKELAEQAATGTYSSAQVEMMNSEYQAMASEIDRIASSTSFNGVRLLDGSLSNLNGGQGMKIHFGTGNGLDTDYYYINTSDTRATTSTGLKIGGDGANDIWSTGSFGGMNAGCCGGNIASLQSAATSQRQQAFAYGYNWDGQEDVDSALLDARHLAGRYGNSAGITYERLIEEVNRGTQSRIQIEISAAQIVAAGNNPGNTNYYALCLGSDEAYFFGDQAIVEAALPGKAIYTNIAATNRARGIADAINGTVNSEFWAMTSGGMLYVFSKTGGDNNSLLAEERWSSPLDSGYSTFHNVQTGQVTSSIGKFTLGGEDWATMTASQQNGGGWALALLGNDIGDQMDIRIAGTADVQFSNHLDSGSIVAANQTTSLLRGDNFSELQNAADGRWAGAEIRTQESASRALAALDDAILRKDQIRAGLGAWQSRLESVIESQTIHMENLQAAESRISDVDVAMEMTEFTRANILTQAATAMLAQANSMSSLALSLILG
jgi:flagellin